MEYDKSLKIIVQNTEKISGRSGLDKDTALIGDGSVMDSMRLVELCLALEDKATELGFDFDWTSESAMSRARSMFRTIGSLATEYAAQSKR